MSKTLIDRLREVLIRSIGDTRECPHCGKAFIPEDKTTRETFKIYKILFRRRKKILIE
jgi:hypothetical protein